MLSPGPAKKVSIYVGEDQQYHGHALYAAILDYLFSSRRFRTPMWFGALPDSAPITKCTRRASCDLTENLPVKIEFIESAEKVDEMLPKLREMVETGLIEVQDTVVVKCV